MSTLASSVLAIWGVGPTELIIILVILLLLFGGAKLPALAKGLGQSIKEFKNAAKDEPKEEKKPDPTPKTGNN
jgi:sec-independent protein translocase protein TatA